MSIIMDILEIKMTISFKFLKNKLPGQSDQYFTLYQPLDEYFKTIHTLQTNPFMIKYLVVTSDDDVHGTFPTVFADIFSKNPMLINLLNDDQLQAFDFNNEGKNILFTILSKDIRLFYALVKYLHNSTIIDIVKQWPSCLLYDPPLSEDELYYIVATIPKAIRWIKHPSDQLIKKALIQDPGLIAEIPLPIDDSKEILRHAIYSQCWLINKPWFQNCINGLPSKTDSISLWLLARTKHIAAWQQYNYSEWVQHYWQHHGLRSRPTSKTAWELALKNTPKKDLIEILLHNSAPIYSDFNIWSPLAFITLLNRKIPDEVFEKIITRLQNVILYIKDSFCIYFRSIPLEQMHYSALWYQICKLLANAGPSYNKYLINMSICNPRFLSIYLDKEAENIFPGNVVYEALKNAIWALPILAKHFHTLTTGERSYILSLKLDAAIIIALLKISPALTVEEWLIVLENNKISDHMKNTLINSTTSAGIKFAHVLPEANQDLQDLQDAELPQRCVVCYGSKNLTLKYCQNIHKDFLCCSCIETIKKSKTSACPVCRKTDWGITYTVTAYIPDEKLTTYELKPSLFNK